MHAACSGVPTFLEDRLKQVVHFFMDSRCSRRIPSSFSKCRKHFTAPYMLFGPSDVRSAMNIALPPDPSSADSWSSDSFSRMMRNMSDSGSMRERSRGPHKYLSVFSVDKINSLTRFSYASSEEDWKSQLGIASNCWVAILGALCSSATNVGAHPIHGVNAQRVELREREEQSVRNYPHECLDWSIRS